ncbi:EAL domain-containing protein [Paraconexibacter sp.]|uniref:EAL domain-containing protein n=1 Tax=Paraconexibacter sp. TaxID=2949640 RepID=UPI0035694DC1
MTASTPTSLLQHSPLPAGAGPQETPPWARTAAEACSTFVVVLGVAVLLAWVVGVVEVPRVVPGLPAMVPLTAAGLVLAAGGIRALTRGHRGRLVLAAGAAAVLIGVLVTFEYVSGISLGIDGWLPHAGSIDHPLRPSPHSAAALILLGATVVALVRDGGTFGPWSLGLTLAGAFVVLLGDLGYLYGVDELYGLSAVTGMAPHTALASSMLVAALLLLRAHRAPLVWFSRPGVDGVMARRLLPVALLGPAVIGGLRLVGEVLGLYDGRFGLALFATMMTVALLAVVSAAVLAAGRIDRARVAAERETHRHHAILNGIVENSPAAICLRDAEDRFLFVNEPAAAQFGLARDDMLGRTVDDVLSGSAALRDLDEGTVRAGGAPILHEERVEHPDGTEHTMLASRFGVHDDQGDLVGIGGITVDISDVKRAQQHARLAEERFRLAFDGSPLGMVLMSIEGEVLRINAAMCAITGYSEEQLLGTSWQSIIHPDDLGPMRQTAESVLSGQLASAHTEHRFLRGTAREPAWVSTHVTLLRNADGEPLHFLAQSQDISDKRRYEQRLRHLADHDPLTGLYNRRYFADQIERQHAHVERYGPAGALLVLDLDHFKVVNDSVGHNAGDELIVSVAGILSNRLRTSDTVARLGGDEFAVLLPDATREEAEHVATSLGDAIRRSASVLSGARPRTITASFGVAMFDGAATCGEDVLVNADLAMYDAKEAGRDRLAHFASARYAQARTKARVAWVDRIVHALEEDRFTLHAQPILDLRTNEVTQYELLLRMVDERGAEVPPAAFLYVAERFDIVDRLDLWVIERAFTIASEVRVAERPLTFEINLSGKTLIDPELADKIQDALRRHDVAPETIIFEITETAAVANIHHARRFAERLGDVGCRFALDDFGAGFGSFYYLKHLPFDYLKIDGEFVSNCLNSRTDQLVIDAVVRIAQGLGKETIAEFVEDDRTRRYLARAGVDFAQGFELGRPAPVPEAFGTHGLTTG